MESVSSSALREQYYQSRSAFFVAESGKRSQDPTDSQERYLSGKGYERLKLKGELFDAHLLIPDTKQNSAFIAGINSFFAGLDTVARFSPAFFDQVLLTPANETARDAAQHSQVDLDDYDVRAVYLKGDLDPKTGYFKIVFHVWVKRIAPQNK